ncbi:iron complex transport system ATP-binding protein [Sinosporangium album]|uniref:Iron complex transport system ATP-binding protein n=1 Tax=Sinosporangium album TaxID=504805 RepID=A0A1G8K3J1_9ACTN|nr:ABC transporter ATP-binding protein [Sinosporangium album]SDI38008.1 iron complex transport system ATP-binding protein [Sinosporangium album]
MRLSLTSVSVRLGTAPIVADCDLTVGDGERVGLVGPNGSGKTSLMRTIYRALDPVAGSVALAGDDIRTLSQRQIARRAALVAQDNAPDFDFTVEEVVAMGRGPWIGAFETTTGRNNAPIASALERVGLAGHRTRRLSTLSGGERQRALVARALAQESPLLLLDEPTNHLDVHTALELLELVRDLGRATLCVLHDLNLAATYCDRLYVLHRGRIVANGPPEEVLDPELVQAVFGVTCTHLAHPITGGLLLAFSPLHAAPVPALGKGSNQ